MNIDEYVGYEKPVLTKVKDNVYVAFYKAILKEDKDFVDIIQTTQKTKVSLYLKTFNKVTKVVDKVKNKSLKNKEK